MAKILLVEDDPMQRRHYSLFLGSDDGGKHQVDEVNCATEAVRMLQESRYDLILLDIMLAFQDVDKSNQDIIPHDVDYGRKMGLYVYNVVQTMSNPTPIALISVIDDCGILSEFPEIVGYLGKYFEEEEFKNLVDESLEQSARG